MRKVWDIFEHQNVQFGFHFVNLILENDPKVLSCTLITDMHGCMYNLLNKSIVNMQYALFISSSKFDRL